jgi:hypothetical protein
MRMQKQFEIVPKQDAWDVRHNQISFRTCQAKRDAIRVALTLGRMQLRLGDDAEITLFDTDGSATARRRLRAPRRA